MERGNFLYIAIGTNRTGKSSVMASLAEKWKEANPDQLVIAFDPQKRFKDVLDIEIEPDDDEWAIKCCDYRNCLIIIDDYRLINEGDRPVKGLMRLLYYRADWNIDLIFICHNPALVINAIAGFATHYFIFMTNAQEGAFKKKIPNYTLCIVASAMVNKHVAIFGKGSYPVFRYVILDCEHQKLMAFNMTKNMGSINKSEVELDDETKSLIGEEKKQSKRIGLPNKK